jgi:hypothetical protein
LEVPDYRRCALETGIADSKPWSATMTLFERIDGLVRSADQRCETELAGLRVHELKRREILLEPVNWIVAAEDSLKNRLGMRDIP